MKLIFLTRYFLCLFVFTLITPGIAQDDLEFTVPIQIIDNRTKNFPVDSVITQGVLVYEYGIKGRARLEVVISGSHPTRFQSVDWLPSVITGEAATDIYNHMTRSEELAVRHASHHGTSLGYSVKRGTDEYNMLIAHQIPMAQLTLINNGIDTTVIRFYVTVNAKTFVNKIDKQGHTKIVPLVNSGMPIDRLQSWGVFKTAYDEEFPHPFYIGLFTLSEGGATLEIPFRNIGSETPTQLVLTPEIEYIRARVLATMEGHSSADVPIINLNPMTISLATKYNYIKAVKEHAVLREAILEGQFVTPNPLISQEIWHEKLRLLNRLYVAMQHHGEVTLTREDFNRLDCKYIP
jgi:hypothetical protein